MNKLISNKSFLTNDVTGNNLFQTDWVVLTCVKVIKIANFSNFKIGSFSEHPITVKDFDTSFFKPFELMNILVFPNGFNDKHKDFVSIAVDILEINRHNLRFECTLGILDKNEELLIPQSFSFDGNRKLDLKSYKRNIQDVGLERYVSRSKLLEEADELLLQDCLNLQCELSYSIPKQVVNIFGYQYQTLNYVSYHLYGTDGNVINYFNYESGEKLFGSVEDALEIYKMAHILGNEELSTKCSRYLACNLDFNNILKLSSLAFMFKDFRLKSEIAAFIPANKLILLEYSFQRYSFLRGMYKLLKTEIPLGEKKSNITNQGNNVCSLQELVKNYLRKKTLMLIKSLDEKRELYYVWRF